MTDLRSMIRDVIREEILAIKASLSAGSPQIVREQVDIRNDNDLDAFVKRILELGQDPGTRNQILSGQHQFSLGVNESPISPPMPRHVVPAPAVPPAPARSSTPEPVARQEFKGSLMTERDIEKLPDGTRLITLSNSVRLTPLALDELRRLNIRIERKTA